MKIGMVTTQFMEIGGVENVVRDVSKRLKEKGHKVILITRQRPQNTKIFGRFFDDVIILKKSCSFKDYLLNSRKQFLEMKDIDIFHFHNWSTIIPLSFSKIKKVLTLHGTSTQVFSDLKKWHKVIPMWFIEQFSINIPNFMPFF